MLGKFLSPPLRLLTQIVLLVLMVWHAPIPVCHRHGDYEATVGDLSFVQHLDVHHGGIANAPKWPDDWHWHWICPGDDFVGLGGQVVVSMMDQVLSTPSFELAKATCSSWLAVPTMESTSLCGRIPIHRRYSFHSVALMHSRQSLPEILGVMLL